MLLGVVILFLDADLEFDSCRLVFLVHKLNLQEKSFSTILTNIL